MALWDVDAPTFSVDSRLTDGGEVASLNAPPTLYLQKDSVYSFLFRQSQPQAGRIRSIEESSDLMRNRTRDLPACSIVSQPTTLPRALDLIRNFWKSEVYSSPQKWFAITKFWMASGNLFYELKQSLAATSDSESPVANILRFDH
jgi:hypothetical protein